MENTLYPDQETQFQEIRRALKKIHYGSVEITIHASRIVQIEMREKRRFEKHNSQE